MDPSRQKLDALRAALAGMRPVAVAFSGGVDSAFLLDVAHEVLGADAVAVTAVSALAPRRDIEDAKRFCRERGIRQELVPFDPFGVPGFAANPPDRCYICKKAIFGAVFRFAAERGLVAVVDGTSAGDDGDYRPGRRALAELGVRSPLLDAGFSKDEIRACARSRGIGVADKPSSACLASRFPYGARITAEGLSRVDAAEERLRGLGICGGAVRVRVHGDVARVETPPEAVPAFAARGPEIAAALKECGFRYVSLDLEGYRTGSLNEALGARAAAPKAPPSPNLGFARVDVSRSARQGLGEAVYGAGKTAEQIVEILRVLAAHGETPALVTRIDAEKAAAAAAAFGDGWEYFPEARLGRLGAPRPAAGDGEITVACGGTSDVPVAEEAALTAETAGCRVRRLYDIGVAGLHRILENVETLRSSRVIVAVAGMEGALPSVIGGLVPCPVVAVPTSVGYGASFGGATALLAMMNSCAAGISVVNIDNGFGAGLLASRICQIGDKP